jgi:hypothetical protein
MRVTSFIAFAICLVLALVIVDPGVSHAMLSTPFAMLLIGTAFPIDPLDKIMTLAEWRTLRRISASTERRMRKAGLGPKLVRISAGLIGVRVRDDIAWMEAGGTSCASGASPNPPTRNTGRDTRAATAASVAKRKERKAAAPPPPAAAPAEPAQRAATTGSVDATA